MYRLFLLPSYLLLAGLLSSTGERVQVKIPTPPFHSCSALDRFDVTVLRRPGNGDVISLQLTRNEVVTLPRHVVLMSSDEMTGEMRYEQTQITHSSQPFHDPQRAGVFSVHCGRHNLQGSSPFLALEGTFFEAGSKFMLKPSDDDDVEHGQDQGTASYVMQKIREFDAPRDHDFIHAAVADDPQTGPPKPAAWSGPDDHHRVRRGIPTTSNYYIDVLPVVDFRLYSRWLEETNQNEKASLAAISTYLTNVFASMSIRLDTLNLTNRILNLRMLEPFVSKDANVSQYTEDVKENSPEGGTRVNVEVALDQFKAWVQQHFSSLGKPDHAMVFTGYDVYGGNDGEVGGNLTMGLAYLGTICRQDGSSSSIVSDNMAYQSEPVAVHELGHSMGSLHDGQNNSCSSSDRHVMSDGSYDQTEANRLNPFSFSSCSSDAILDTLAILESENSCLSNQAGRALTTIAPLNAIDQCQALFGPLSYVCRGSTFPDVGMVCTDLYCAIPGTNKCRQLAAATGTCCGNGKFCKKGICVDASQGNCAMDAECPLADQPGIVVQNQTCEQLHPAYCYQSDLRQRCCHRCRTAKTSIPGCLFGDRATECRAEGCGDTQESGVKYNSICCQTCANVTDGSVTCKDQPKVAFQNKSYSCPDFLQTQGSHFCYYQAVLAVCCLSCDDRLTGNSGCPYGDQRHRFNCHKIPPLNRSCDDRERDRCCQTCPTLDHLPPAPTSPPDQTTGQTATTEGCSGQLCDHAPNRGPSLWPLLPAAFLAWRRFCPGLWL